MADPLPPLEQIPDLQPGESASPSASWARRFGGQDRSLAQRTRHNEDIRAFAEDLQRQRERHQEEELRTNKSARDLYFRQQAADLKEALAVKQLHRDEEIHKMRLQNMQAAHDAAFALQREREARETAINEKAARDASDRTAFYEGITALDKELTPDNPEYAKRALGLGMRFGKTVDPETRKIVFDRAGLTSVSDPVEEAQKVMDAFGALEPFLKEHNLDLHMQKTPLGKYGFTLREKSATAPRQGENPELKTLKSGLAQAEVKESMTPEIGKPDVQAGIESIKNKISAVENATGSTSGAGMGDVKAAESTQLSVAPAPGPVRKIVRGPDGKLNFSQ